MIKIHNGDNRKDDALSCMQCSQYSGDDFILHSHWCIVKDSHWCIVMKAKLKEDVKNCIGRRRNIN